MNEFSDQDYRRALAVGNDQWNAAKQLGRGEGHGEPGDAGKADRTETGYLGELAYALEFGLPWRPWHGWGSGDFGRNEIRSTRYSGGNLIVFDNDGLDKLFWLVIVIGRNWRVVGSIEGRNAEKVWFRPNERQVRSGSKRQFWVAQGHLTTYRRAKPAPRPTEYRRPVQKSLF